MWEKQAFINLENLRKLLGDSGIKEDGYYGVDNMLVHCCLQAIVVDFHDIIDKEL